jgi:hypothetical protein
MFQLKKMQPPIDLVKAFEKDNIDLAPFQKSKVLAKQVQGSINRYTGEFGIKQKRHLLNRTMVGFASRHLKDLDGLSLEQAVDLIFTYTDLGEPINNYYNYFSAEAYKDTYGSDDVGPGEPFISRPLRTNDQIPSENAGAERQAALSSWHHYSMYNQPTNVGWKFFLFLHNLTPVSDEHTSQKWMYSYIKMVYDAPYRNYKDYIYDLTLHPIMLVYLNLAFSQKDTPDENFAREVQELFTVGKRPFAQFTESDVKEAARILVGWGYDYNNQFTEGFLHTPQFNDHNHDTGNKQFSSFYSNTLIQGRQGQAGADELKEFYDMIFETDEVAIYLSRRLFQFFVYPVLTDDVEENIIRPLAAVMRSSNYSLAETLKVLLSSEYFFAEDFYNSMIKSPLDYSMGILKETNYLEGDLVDHDGQGNDFNSFFNEDRGRFPDMLFDKNHRVHTFFGNGFQHHYLPNQGFSVLYPPSVSGWPAYYQEPVYDLFWLNSVTIKAKKRFCEGLVMWGINLDFTSTIKLKISLWNFFQDLRNPSDVDDFINEVSAKFLSASIPEKNYQSLRIALVGGESLSDYYWTQAVTNFLQRKDKEAYNTLYTRTERFLILLFDLNEIHVF